MNILTAILLVAIFNSCEENRLYDPSDIGEGEASISAVLNFYEISSTLKSRANDDAPALVTGGTSGKAIGEINSICVLLYDIDGNLVKKFTQDDLEDYNYNSTANSETSSDAVGANEHQAEAKTGQATFNIGKLKPENRIAFGKYRMYAVANMSDLSAYDTDIQTEKGLKEISLRWKTNVAENNQMFGYFTMEDNKKSEDFNGVDLIINKSDVTFHAWLKRIVSKVTVAFDARNLKENIYIYIKSVEIKDIPESCYLGAENPGDPGAEGSKGKEISLVANDASGHQMIQYHTGDIPANLNPDNWPQFVAKGRPIYGANPTAALNTQLSVEDRINAQHGEDVAALYFFENMQGKGVAGTPSDKRQQVNQKDKDDKVVSYPNGNDPNDKGWKDAKPYGTYIEVKAYYFSINPGDPGQGDITYRFMLGKDVETDYNAMRNYHYKLTLCFNGYANDTDWHIVYEKENRKIENPNPYYISYLYNHSMMLPLEVTTGSATITKIDATIEENNWGPLDADYGTAVSNPNQAQYNDDYFLYWTGAPSYNCNGFLSLRKTTETVITSLPPFTTNINANYYNSAQRGSVSYSSSELGEQYTDFTKSSDISVEEALEEGKLHVYKSINKDGNYYAINMPLWTRAKQLIKQTAYTGNNPYVAYQREAKIKIVVTLSDGSTLTTGLSTNNGAQSGELISIRQVRRIVNPKGIWRKGDNDENFHVVLHRLPDEESTKFESFPSEGPWRAYVMRDTKRGEGNNDNWDDANGTIKLKGASGTTTGSISLRDRNGITRTYQTIEGSTGSNIDFTVEFNGTTSEDNPNYAVIRVEYHNYTCYHLIFVRQGYGADDLIDGGAKWMASNNIAQSKVADCPLDEGSMFKFGNWKGITSSNNKNSKSPWIMVTPDDFRENAASTLTFTDGTTGGWSDITPVRTDGDGNSFPDQTGMRVAEFSDYKALYDSQDIEQGYGVLYGDASNKTLTDLTSVYGYMTDDDDKDKGMRGCFVYNYRTGKNLFFPIGASGYGHRKNTQTDNGTNTVYRGVLRYACSGRWGYFPTGTLGTQKIPDPNNPNDPNATITVEVYPQGVNDCPLFLDIFRRSGALYWLKKIDTNPMEAGKLCGWDINYFTFDFFPISESNVDYGRDALFVRSIKQ